MTDFSFAERIQHNLVYTSSYDKEMSKMATVFINEAAYQACMEHALSDVGREVGGYLVGTYQKLEDGRYNTLIEHVLPARYTDASQIHLTFTTESQADMADRREAEYPEKPFIGWFHTHPNMGIFYSHYDHWLHSSFFSRPYHVGLVIDPVKSTGGFFIWQKRGNNSELNTVQYGGCVATFETKDYKPYIHWTNLKLDHKSMAVHPPDASQSSSESPVNPYTSQNQDAEEAANSNLDVND